VRVRAAPPSEGIMAIYHQFRHLWSRSTAHMGSSGRNHHPSRQHQPVPPPAPSPILHMQSQPLPILLPIFGLTAAAA
jgi:hypothetical protein